VRITDLLFSYAGPGAVVVDLTAESAGLSGHAALAPELGLPYRRGTTGLGAGTARALVLHTLPGDDEGAGLDLDRFAGLAPAVIHVVFCDRVEAFLERGLIDSAARGGYELASTHYTEHKIFRFAAVLRRPDGEASPSRLRLVNEYRFDKLLLRELERGESRVVHERDAERAKLSELQTAYQRLLAEHRQKQDDYRRMRAQCERLSRASDEARRDAEEQSKQIQAYQTRLVATFRALEKSRKSLSFRLGRATWAAVRGGGLNVFGMPRRWVRALRGPDEVVEKLRDVPSLGPAAAAQSRQELDSIEKSILLGGLEQSAGPGVGVAGLVGPRLAAELSASAPFRALPPHSWRHLLEAEPPAYVLVTSDGLQAGSPWASWGTPGGRDGAHLARELVAWCRGQHLPVVYWDTTGAERRLPPGMRFDAVFTVSRRNGARLDRAAEVLAPAVQLLVWNPIAVDRAAPRNPIYVGAFDSRGDKVELAALGAILAAAAGRGLEILDSHHGVQGLLAEAVRFPAELRALARRRPPIGAEKSAIQSAGILVCGNPARECDAPSWELLRGLAMGAHVLSTPAAFDDGALAQAVPWAADEASAGEALDRLARRPLLDATWRAGFHHLVAHYCLGDRLDQIARRIGAQPVAVPRPSVALVARLASAADARALRGFLTAQTALPIDVRVLVDADLSVEAQLREVVGARIAVARAEDSNAAHVLIDTSATHLLFWRAGTPPLPELVAELTRAAHLTEAKVLALAAEAGPTPYRYGAPPPEAAVAVARTAVQDRLRAGTSIEGVVAAQLAADGADCFIASPSGSAAADSARSVA